MVSVRAGSVGLGLGVIVILIVVAIVYKAPITFPGFDLYSSRIEIRDRATIVRQDASQRAVLVVPRDEHGAKFTACSEPPPDIAQNIAQSLDSSLTLAKKAGEKESSPDAVAKISGDLKEAAQLLFQRSQGIQLLRDTMFRLCEGLQNGVLGERSYGELIHGLIDTANFIIPFEQCTGMARTNQNGKLTDEIQNLLLRNCLDAALKFNRANAIDEQPTPGTPSQKEPSQPFSLSTNDKRVAYLVQARLDMLQYPLKLDGSFGPNSSAALSAFQGKHGLNATGILDAETWKALWK